MKTFRCFSVPLKTFLISKKFKYELIAIDPTSNKKFWLFFRTEEFNNALTEWRENNPNKLRTQ